MKDTHSSDLKNQDLSNDKLNSGLTAIPKGAASADQASADPDLVASDMDFGSTNEQEARESGYIGEDGKAVSKARPNTEGSPTGAYTDVGAGRSSAVVSKNKKDKNHH